MFAADWSTVASIIIRLVTVIRVLTNKLLDQPSTNDAYHILELRCSAT